MQHNILSEDDKRQLVINLAGDIRHFQPIPLEKLNQDNKSNSLAKTEFDISESFFVAPPKF